MMDFASLEIGMFELFMLVYSLIYANISVFFIYDSVRLHLLEAGISNIRYRWNLSKGRHCG